jgi:hypothetical protein
MFVAIVATADPTLSTERLEALHERLIAGPIGRCA